MKRLDAAMGEDDVKLAFQLIDVDSSQTITFQEFNTYYLKCIMGRSTENGRRP